MNDNSFKYDNWKNPERLKKHSVSKVHLLTMTKWSGSEIAKLRHQNELTQIQSHHASEVADNRKYLRELIMIVATLAKQNISFGNTCVRSMLWHQS